MFSGEVGKREKKKTLKKKNTQINQRGKKLRGGGNGAFREQKTLKKEGCKKTAPGRVLLFKNP